MGVCQMGIMHICLGSILTDITPDRVITDSEREKLHSVIFTKPDSENVKTVQDVMNYLTAQQQFTYCIPSRNH
jgi:GH24 family phage-related lysozyme (muramidase)